MGNCGTSINLGAIAAVGYAARFSVLPKDESGESVEVPFDHAVNTFEMVISSAPVTVVLTTIPRSHLAKVEADLDKLF